MGITFPNVSTVDKSKRGSFTDGGQIMNRKEMGQLIGSLAAGKGELMVKLEKKDEIIRQQAKAIQRMGHELCVLRRWVDEVNPN
jgi:hypothetical protein